MTERLSGKQSQVRCTSAFWAMNEPSKSEDGSRTKNYRVAKAKPPIGSLLYQCTHPRAYCATYNEMQRVWSRQTRSTRYVHIVRRCECDFSISLCVKSCRIAVQVSLMCLSLEFVRIPPLCCLERHYEWKNHRRLMLLVARQNYIVTQYWVCCFWTMFN